MEPTRRNVLGAAAGAIAIAIAGCAGDGDADQSPTASATRTEPGGATTSKPGTTATVRTRSHPDHGTIIVDAEGMSLYMFENDTQGETSSSCHDSCASAWPPLTVAGEATKGGAVEADLTTFEREGGETQVAANGWPLYYYASDQEPGDAGGQGSNDVWWLLGAEGEPIKPDEPSGGGY